MEQRIIKFRAWDTFNERMIEPYLFQPSTDMDKSEGDERFNAPFTYYETWQDVDDGIRRPCYIMQFTGFCDKTGKEIYEGDIVDLHPEDNDKVWNRKIVYDSAAFHCVQIHGKANYPLHFNKHLKDLKWVIIGNIYENPELL